LTPENDHSGASSAHHLHEPEQIQGGGRRGRDIYGLAPCSTNAWPAKRRSSARCIRCARIVAEMPPALKVRSVEVDEEPDAWVSCLAKDPAQRPKNGRELAGGLRRAAARLAAKPCAG